jgi:simple sugar transport system ATP-binding protein
MDGSIGRTGEKQMSELQMTNIFKSYEGVTVLNGVNFQVNKGEVHALLGMNGAGKSTLMKILAGDLQPDDGKITIDGKEYTFSSPFDAKKAGIGFVAQEVDTSLFPALSVCENITANEIIETTKRPFFSWSKQKQRANDLLHQVGLQIDINKLINECSLHEKQLILLAKVLSSSARYIILDEPTAPLSDTETKTLFQIIQQLKSRGVSFIYISHKLREIKEICDRVTILRDGKVVHSSHVSEVTMEEMIEHMLGQTHKSQKKKKRILSEEIVFEVKNVFIPKTKTTVNLKIRKGEIVGIAGLVGAGKTELAHCLFGLERTTGKWLIHGKEYSISSPIEAIEAGISYIPEERRKQGLFINENIQKNLTVRLLSSCTNFQWIRRQKEEKIALNLIDTLHIRPSLPKIVVKHLSGGNQQKVVIGKWLNTNSDVFIFDEPTKGIDVKAKAEILAIIQSLAEQGKAVLYLTNEFQELLDIADTIHVMAEGKLVKSFTCEEATTEQLLFYSSGGGALWHKQPS